MTQLHLQAACAFGLEAIVKRELFDLGYVGRVVQPGRVAFDGDWLSVCRTNLWLRTADRILIVVKQFPANDFDELFETTKAIDWLAYLPFDATFPVTGRSRHSKLSSVPACQRSIKKAIVESLHQSSGRSLPETGPLFKIDVALLNDQATLTIDTTGSSLHKRGYRKLAAVAPLKETLAAAMVLLSFLNRQRPLIDPFCGSGTIPIEAAMIGLNIAPGLQREFIAETWTDTLRTTWAEQRQLAQVDRGDNRRGAPHASEFERILGTDVDGTVLSLARYHAKMAGVDQVIHWQQRPFAELRSKRQYGCLITNPPYGERLGDQRHLKELYLSIPQVLSRLPTWSHFILTSFPQFEKTIQQTADRRRKLYNGRIECTYYQFHGPRPDATTHGSGRGSADVDETIAEDRPTITESEKVSQNSKLADPVELAEVALEKEGVPLSNSNGLIGNMASSPPVADELKSIQSTPSSKVVFGELSAKAEQQSELFAARLKKRARHLRRWPTRQGITCYRLYDRDIPEIPLVIERFEDCLHISEYERPSDRDLGQQATWLELMARTAAKSLGVDRNHVFVKSRQRQRGHAQYQKLADSNHRLIVREGGLKFLVNLTDFVDTGLFLDHRNTRSIVRDNAAGKRFLNLFAYTGSFSVYAASGNAASTTTVDWSNTYLNWAVENMQLNGFTGVEHRFERQDAVAYVASLPQHPQFDLAVIDPPTFSNSKRTEQEWDTQRDHAALIQAVALRMSRPSTIFFSTNYRRFKLADDALANLEIRELSKQTVPEDFRNQRIHRCWRITVQ